MERHGDERPRLVNMYGITETTVHVTYREITRADLDRAGSPIGVPIPDLSLYVLDSRLEPVPPGVPGEIFVGGAGVARGYLNRPELTAERFLRDPFSADPAARLYRSGDPSRPASSVRRRAMEPQFDLFGGPGEASAPGPALPEGFRYRPDLIGPADEDGLLARARELPFRDFEFHGHTGKRRVVSFGWHYDFDAGRLRKADDIPGFLLALRPAAAAFAGVEPEALQHVLVTEYGPGAGIGWHRDRAVFGEVVGISLLAPCVFRLRRRLGERWERVNLVAEPRSAYLLSGPARSEWEHSIPPVDALRYSITFRNLREG